MDILNSTRTTDITPALKALSMDERDTLMKYLYRGMEMGRLPSAPAPINCAVILSWHEKVCIKLEYRVSAQMNVQERRCVGRRT